MEYLIQLGRKLWDAAEPGFHEVKTGKILTAAFTEAGFILEKFGNFPGFAATVDGNYRTKKVALIADMDALPLPGSEPRQYIHSCGHHVQLTALAGAAAALQKSKPELLKHISFMAIPAEEYIDLEKRETLRQEGKISQLSGKLELIQRGVFNYPDVIISMHSAAFSNPLYISSVRAMSGFDVMHFTFTGAASHAGASPHKGINAQNAAVLFLQACAFQRESFNEDMHVRIHPILKLAENQSVNLIPDYAFVETYVRSADPETIQEVSRKLKNAAEGCAQAIGAGVTVETIPGYAPFRADMRLHTLLQETAQAEGIPFIDEAYSSASTDVGNISQLKPTIMLGLPGVNGKFHNPAFRVTDEEAAYVFPASFLVHYLEKVCSFS